MFVTYAPEGQAAREWEFRPGKIRNGRMAQIENAYKRIGGGSGPVTWDAWLTAVDNGSTAAKQVLLWHFLNLDHPTLRVEDVDFSSDELKIQSSKAELLATRPERLNAAKLFLAAAGLPADDTAEVEKVFDDAIAAAPEGSEGKAPSSPSLTSTALDSSSSPESPSTSSPTD